MPVTSTIKPAGGGDYTTLQAWADAMDHLASDTYTAECYSGGNLGALTLLAWATGAMPIIQPAVGNEHNGSLTDGAYAEVDNQCISIMIDKVTIKGIRLKSTTGAAGSVIGASVATPVTSCVIDGCLIESTLTTGAARTGIDWTNLSGTSQAGLRFSNNIIVATAGASAQRAGIAVTTISFSASTASTTCDIFNNTIINGSHRGAGVELSRQVFSGTGNLTATVRNNVAIGSLTADFRTATNSGTGTLTITASNNASSDGTASSWAGGTDHLTSVVAADCFIDPATDWSLIVDSPLIETGFNLSATFTNDAFGNTRTLPWDLGAYGGDPVEPPGPEVSASSCMFLFPTLFPM